MAGCWGHSVLRWCHLSVWSHWAANLASAASCSSKLPVLQRERWGIPFASCYLHCSCIFEEQVTKKAGLPQHLVLWVFFASHALRWWCVQALLEVRNILRVLLFQDLMAPCLKNIKYKHWEARGGEGREVKTFKDSFLTPQLQSLYWCQGLVSMTVQPRGSNKRVK